MADTTASTENIVTKWKAKTFNEYVRNSRFSKYMGTGSNNIIVMREDERQKFSVPMIARLKGAGVTTGTLAGNEEALANFGWELEPGYKRHAVVATKDEIEKVAFNMMGEARSALSTWAREEVRDDTLNGLGAIYNGTTYSTYAAATEAAKDTWLTNNDGTVNRVLFGNAKANQSGTDHSASLANVDSTNDVLTSGIVSLMKRMALTADPHITPIKVTDDEEMFVLFVGSLARRDLLADTAFLQAQREANVRGASNPLFKGGDLLWDNVIIREVPEVAVISGVGNSSIDVEPAYMCGVEAIGFGLGQRPKPTRLAETDYEFRNGVGIEFKHDIKKMYWNNIQNGMVTGYFAGVADA